MPKNDGKHLLKSKTVWGAGLTAASAFFPPLLPFGLALSAYGIRDAQGKLKVR